MTILATNKAKKDLIDGSAFDIFGGIICFVLSLAFSLLIYPATINLSGFDWILMLFLILVVALFLAYMGLIHIDNHLRWNRAEETIWVKDGMLVIDCQGSILRKHKEISLSRIRKIKKFDRLEILRGTYSPDRLRIYYSIRRRYRFGICMNPKQRDELAQKIMDLVEQCS